MNVKYVVFFSNKSFSNILSSLTSEIDMKDIIIIKTSQKVERIYFFGYIYIETTENNFSLSSINMIKKYSNNILISSSYYMFLDHRCSLLPKFHEKITSLLENNKSCDAFINQRPCNNVFLIHRNLLHNCCNYTNIKEKDVKDLDIGLVVRSMEHILNSAYNIKYLRPIIVNKNCLEYQDFNVILNDELYIRPEDDDFYKLELKKYKLKKGKRRKFWKNSFS